MDKIILKQLVSNIYIQVTSKHVLFLFNLNHVSHLHLGIIYLLPLADEGRSKQHYILAIFITQLLYVKCSETLHLLNHLILTTAL